ncbi:hypothetical protein C8Q78DRAFT_793007 [Trametes maxima]|nr:hypothetical protein C8Q78DRAFT_793007 [Trametes maxima]
MPAAALDLLVLALDLPHAIARLGCCYRPRLLVMRPVAVVVARTRGQRRPLHVRRGCGASVVRQAWREIPRPVRMNACSRLHCADVMRRVAAQHMTHARHVHTRPLSSSSHDAHSSLDAGRRCVPSLEDMARAVAVPHSEPTSHAELTKPANFVFYSCTHVPILASSTPRDLALERTRSTQLTLSARFHHLLSSEHWDPEISHISLV